MQIFRSIRLPFYQAPDASPGGSDGEPAPASENVLGAEPPAPEPPDPEPPAPEPEKADGRKNPWYLKRIADEAEARRVAEQRATDAEALAARLQAGKELPAGDPPRATPQQPNQDFNAAVRSEAQRIRLSEDSSAVRDAGMREFGNNFGQSLSILTAVGATSDDMVLDLIAVDKANAHKILANLAKDPEKAASLVGMDSRRRIAELTRMADAIVAPKSETQAPKAAAPGKQVSRAPAPPPPVDPSSSKTVDWRSDEASEEEFQRGWEAENAKRSARGRR